MAERTFSLEEAQSLLPVLESLLRTAIDGKKVIEASDESFKDVGKVGVWTKADSVTLFDDFTYGGK